MRSFKGNIHVWTSVVHRSQLGPPVCLCCPFFGWLIAIVSAMLFFDTILCYGGFEFVLRCRFDFSKRATHPIIHQIPFGMIFFCVLTTWINKTRLPLGAWNQKYPANFWPWMGQHVLSCLNLFLQVCGSMIALDVAVEKCCVSCAEALPEDQLVIWFDWLNDGLLDWRVDWCCKCISLLYQCFIVFLWNMCTGARLNARCYKTRLSFAA